MHACAVSSPNLYHRGLCTCVQRRRKKKSLPTRPERPKRMSEFTKDIIVIDDDVEIEEFQKAPPNVDNSDNRTSKYVPRPDTLQGGTPPPSFDEVDGDEIGCAEDKDDMIELDLILIEDESCEEEDGDSGDSKQSAKCSENVYSRSCDINDDSSKTSSVASKLAKGFRCKRCRTTFNDTAAYEKHKKTFHSDKFKCPYCPKAFSFPYRLESHVNSHLNLRRFACRFCGQTFVTKSNKTKHERVHTTYGPYKCDECQARFKQKTQLTIHLRNHENTGKILLRDKQVFMLEGKNLFKCPQCPKAFPSFYKLETHFNIHLNLRRFACRFCGQAFVAKSNRTSHELLHTTDAPYKCDECQAKYKRRAQLTIHLRMHTKNAEVFKCSLCGKTFPCSTSFEEHLPTHASERPFSSLFEEPVLTNDQSSIQDNLQDNIRLPEYVHSDEEEADAGLNYGKRKAIIAKIPNSIPANAVLRKNGDQANSRNATSKQGRDAFCCYSCGAIFMEFGAYRGHYRTVHPDMIEVDSFKQIAFVPTVPEEMSCQYCLRIFNNKDVYHSHMENAHLDKLYTCPLCPKTFRNEVTRGRHIDDAHEETMQNGEPNIEIS